MKYLGGALAVSAIAPSAAAAKAFEVWSDVEPTDTDIPGYIAPSDPSVMQQVGKFCKGELNLVSGLRPNEAYRFSFRDEQGKYPVIP